MFFQFVPDQDTMRRMQEGVAKREATSSAQQAGFKVYQAADGAVVIDDPSLVGEAKLLNEVPSLESLQLTSMWIPNVVNQDGGFGAWVPLANLPWWRQQAPAADGQ